VYGKLYRITDKRNPMTKAVIKSNELIADLLLEVIDKHEPDIIIICHAFITNMVSVLKGKGKITAKVISLITDYDSHRTYISPHIDAFVLAEPQMKRKLCEEYGVPEDKIYPLGIPTFDRFSFSETKEALCARERLDPNIPIVLMMAGSFGVTDVLDFYTQLAQSTKDLQIIVITGRNIRLFDHLDRKIQELNTSKNTKLLYFVDNVEDYMHIADLIVTKPGGLTVTESIACHLPMAIYSAFPGQEEDNVTFLLEQNAAVLVDKKNGAQEILDLLHSPEKLAAMKESCKRLALPNAAEDIFNLAKQLCGKE
ncbi:MAG: glycosyltransferase, partial [Ruminococcus sp.]|nr:glycosyltransferase [Ruminococcus sp.]